MAELERAAAVQIWCLWYEDPFHFGAARDSCASAVCLTKAEAEAELARRGGPRTPGWDGYSIEGPWPPAGKDERCPSIGAETVREVLRRIDAREPGPVPVKG
jgi:hypothetical protein